MEDNRTSEAYRGGQEYRQNEELPNGKEKGRSKFVFFLVVAVVILGALAAGAWWAYITLAGPRQAKVVNAIEGYFAAGARNDREAASAFVYMGQDAAELGADDLPGEFNPETFFAYDSIQVQYYFAGEDGAYVHGRVVYNERPPREFTAVLKPREDGNWGLLRLELSEPQPGGNTARMLIGIGGLRS